jgi:hypothetical protein
MQPAATPTGLAEIVSKGFPSRQWRIQGDGLVAQGGLLL